MDTYTDVQHVLNWLELTISTNPECLRVVDEELIRKIDDLVGIADIDLSFRLLPNEA